MSITQVNFLRKQYYKAKEYYKLDSICELQLSDKDSIIRYQAYKIADYSQLVRNKDEQICLKQYQVDKLNEELKVATKRYKQQKTYKIIAICVALTTSVLYLTK